MAMARSYQSHFRTGKMVTPSAHLFRRRSKRITQARLVL
jgi:hypothetical protein